MPGDRMAKPKRSHLEFLGRKGNPDALRALRNPCAYPVALSYLHGWALELAGRSEREDGMLTWPTFLSWCRATDRQPDAAETQGVFAVVSALVRPRKADA